MTAISTTRYNKLPGSRRGLINTATLWAGEDHLLAVASTRFQEQYKRYYYTDIQSISLQRKRQLAGEPLLRVLGLWLLLCLGCFFGLAIAAVRLQASHPIFLVQYLDFLWQAALWVGAAILVYYLVAGLFFSCECRVHTATSTDKLPSLHRVWSARAALHHIDQRIRAAQGELPPDWQERIETTPVQERLETAHTIVAPPESYQKLPGFASTSVFAAVMALTAASGLWRLLVNSPAADQALALSLMASVVLMTAYALRLTGRLSRIMIGLTTVALVILAAAYMTDMLGQFRKGFTKDERFRRMSDVLQQMDPPALHQAMAAGTVAVGAAGLLLAFTSLRKPQSGL